MKWVFYLLLLANALFFSWELRHLEPPRASVAAVVPSAGPAFVNRLLLLSEVSKSELRERGVPLPAEPDVSASTASTPATDGAADASAGLCFSIGPLAADFDPAALRAWITELGGVANLRIGERRERALYWVYFPPLQSREAAIKRVEGMRGEGIGDIYIIPKGDMANAVSLGVYSQRRSLERRLNELRAKGYEPSIVPRYRTRRASWLDVAFRSGFEWPGERFIGRFPELEFSQATCTADQIASLAALPYNPPARRKYLYSDQSNAPEAASESPAPNQRGTLGQQPETNGAAQPPATDVQDAPSVEAVNSGPVNPGSVNPDSGAATTTPLVEPTNPD